MVQVLIINFRENIKIYLIAFSALIMFFAFIIHNFYSRPEHGIQLIDGIYSYTSELNLLANNAQLKFKGVAEKKDEKNGNKISTYEGCDFKHSEVDGCVEISFYENLLMEVRFYPDDELLYEQKNPLSTSAAHLNSWTAVDFRGKKYFGFEDKRLASKASNWTRYK